MTGAKLADGAVGALQLAAGAVGAGKIAAGAVGSGELSDGAVTSSKIARGSVGSNELGDGQVAPADLARPARLIEYAQPAGTTNVPILTAGDLRLQADCSGGGGSPVMLLIEAATSSGIGTIESSGMAENEGGGESTFVNGPSSVSPVFTGATSISDADPGAAGGDGNFKLLYDGPGVAVNVEMTLAAFRAPGTIDVPQAESRCPRADGSATGASEPLYKFAQSCVIVAARLPARLVRPPRLSEETYERRRHR